MRLTGQQLLAVKTEGRALLVDAGAGTGKTAVLVQRFLHLLERHPDWPIDSIVAVTFTEKATREMRSRIRAGVEARAAAEGQESPWQARRRELDRLAVSTIHGLCARLLRENAIAARIDPRFAVLEEQDMGLLREQAVRQALAELAIEAGPDGAQDSPLELLALFETNDLREQMLKLLGQRGTVDRLFATLGDADALLALWRKEASRMREEIWAECQAHNPLCALALEQLPAVSITAPADKLAEHVRYAQEGCAAAARGDLCAAAAAFARIKRNAGAQAAWGGKDALAELKEWLKGAQELGKSLCGRGYDQQVGEDDERAAAALQLWRALWQRVTSVYDALKDELAALDFDDLELQAWRLLTAEPRDERAQATVDGINHLMVDEFQDVNELQGEILTRLADLSAGGKFFGVGDAKQSIYRFRQAQVRVFNTAARAILARTGGAPLPLNRSFRTHAGLCAALNAVFAEVLSPISVEYSDYEARPGPLEAARPPLASSEAAPATVEIIALPPGLADETRRVEAAILAQRLRELVRQQFEVWDKDAAMMRPVRFGDMAILFRATTSLPVYEEVFKGAGLPYITVSGRGYYDRPEIRDLTALLACLHNPADDLSLATVLRSPMFSLSDESLYRLRWLHPDGSRAAAPLSFAAALSGAQDQDCGQAALVAFAGETMAALWAAAGRVDVWTLLRLALDRTGYEATLALADREASGGVAGGGRGRANVAKFLQLARDRGGANLSAFLQSIQDLRSREAREGEALPDAPDAGAVQLMSIHAAKGLEFPVVALADLGRGARSGGSPRILHDPMYGLACQVRDAQGEWFKPVGYRWAEWLDGRMEHAEDKRLLYVACTRAADLLILSGNPKENESWLKVLARALGVEVERREDGTDVGEEICRRDGFSVRVVRPARPDEEDERGGRAQPAGAESAPPLDAVPRLAQPLPPRRADRPIAVTHLPTEREEDDGFLIPTLRPVVRLGGDAARGRRPSRFLVGNLAHRALADWECLAMHDDALRDALTRWARRGGLSAPDDVSAAVDQVLGLVKTLRTTSLYRDICAARERHAEVPLSLRAGEEGRVLHGILDLLYSDAQGQWHLLDWKTERVPRGQTAADAAAGETVRQMAVYIRAVEKILGIAAVAEVCFLSSGAEVYRPAPDTLAAAWDALVAEG